MAATAAGSAPAGSSAPPPARDRHPSRAAATPARRSATFAAMASARESSMRPSWKSTTSKEPSTFSSVQLPSPPRAEATSCSSRRASRAASVAAPRSKPRKWRGEEVARSGAQTAA